MRAFARIDDKDRRRLYRRCGTCEATLLDPAAFLSAAQSRAHYDLHENDVTDAGYRAFLSKLADPLVARLSPGAIGLDFGCGPGPALAHMLCEAGHVVDVYDPHYRPDRTPLSDAKRYDFITMTEVAEHLFAPHRVFTQLATLLKPGGLLAVMTCFQTDDARFRDWHYRKDPTHVVFYRARTFEVIAKQCGLTCEIVAKDVAFLTRPVSGTAWRA
ncbi:MAG: class I SAM-dependent methyltransferase [Pseudomonadota bacterium]